GGPLDLEGVQLDRGWALLDLVATMRGLHLNHLTRLVLGPALQLGVNTDLTVFGTTIIHASTSVWYGNAARISFTDCILLGVFLGAHEIDAVIGERTGV